jgi:hypothetical protein
MPQMKQQWHVLGSFVLAAVLLSAGTHVLLGDYLLFYSDPLSLSVYLSAASLAVLPGLLVLGLSLLCLPRRWREILRLYAALGLAVLVATVFLMLAVSFAGAWLDVTWIKRLARHPFYLFAVCAVPALAAIIARRSPVEIAGRTEQLGLALFAVAVVGLPLMQVIPRDPGKGQTSGGGKHLVLMILDGMPSQHLHSYEPSAPIGPLDRLAAEGLLMTQARSAAVWTYAYFGALYSGSTQVINAPRDQKPATDSLFARLQNGGVSARWISYHRNGMPEGGAVHTHDYRGLRSYLLTAATAWIPRLLNLDYHLAIANPGISQNLRGAPGHALFDWLNGKKPGYKNQLTEQLLPLLREQRGYARDTFTLFHTGWNGTGSAAEEARAQLPRAQEIVGLEDVAKNASQTIRDNDYLYGPELEPLAEQNRRNVDLGMVDLGVHLTDFMAALAADESVRDTVIIITADHGSMYAKGRFWYGFHPNEEVVRVPLLLFNAGRTGRDDRLVSTLDITASVLGFFGLSRDSDSGQSLFAAGRGRERTQTLTLRSDKNKEWFLVISEADRKVRINLHPEGRGETVTLRLDHYEETPVAETIGPSAGMGDVIAAAIRGFGIDPADIHPALRP